MCDYSEVNFLYAIINYNVYIVYFQGDFYSFGKRGF